MDVMDAILKRRSIRDYQDKPVEEQKLTRVLEAGRQAPSASNKQPWKFVVVKDPEIRKAVAGAANNKTWMTTAPVILVGCATATERTMLCGQKPYPIDLSICMTTMSLAAMGEGLGTCWIGAFYEDQVKKVLGIPEEEVRVVELMTLGYPNQDPEAKPRMPMAEFAVVDRWA